MMNRFSSRERWLAAMLCGALFLVGNGTLVSGLMRRHVRLQAELAARGGELRSMRGLLADSAASAERDAWLQASLPPLENPDQAGVQLLEQLNALARAGAVTLEAPELGGVESRGAFRSVTVRVSVRCGWENLIRFLHAVQQPGRFIVFEEASLQADPAAPGRMACRFKIAQWYKS
jgi:hypothetical protein